MAFSLLCSDTAQRHALVDRAVIPHHRGLADDDAAAVVNEDPMSQDRARMDLNQSEKSGDLGDQTAEEPHIVGPEPVSDPVPDQGMDSLV